MSVEDNMLTLAAKYNLAEGKSQDYYNLHGKWCLTKNGGEKIRIAEGISYGYPQCTAVAPFIIYQATFTDKAGNKVHANGSCRFDGTKNTPERSHAPEMAIKRMETRGTIKILGLLAQGIYGDDEFDTDFKQGNQPAHQAHSAPPAQAAHIAPQASPQAAPQGGSGFTPPPEGTKGWIKNGESLPSDWSKVMEDLVRITGEDRSKHERKLYDHSTAWAGPNGLYLQSRKFPTFAEYALSNKEYQGVVSYNAYGALKALEKARAAVDSLATNGMVEISEENGRGGMSLSYVIHSKANNPQFSGDAAGQIAAEFGGSVEGAPSPPEHEVPF